jgi:lysophospholipase L1-like esterase
MSPAISQAATLVTPPGGGVFANAGLSRWRRKLISRPADLKILFVGDSTSDPTLIATNIASRLQGVHTAAGMGLAGMTPANITMVGHAGLWEDDWHKNPAYVKEVFTANPDLIVYSLGINSVRTGGRSQQQLTDGIAADVKLMLAQAPNADIVLRIPNAFSSDDVASNGFIVPNSSAQAYTDALRNAYLSFDGLFPNVVVWNSQDRVFGRTCQTFANMGGLLSDQLHPSITGYQAIADALVADLIGIPPRYTSAPARALINMYDAQRGIPKYTVGDIVSRADSTTSAGTATTGQAYTNNAGVVGTIGNRLYAPSAGTNIATVDSTLANGDFGVTYPVVDTSGSGGCMFVFRLVDQYNYMYLRRYGASLYMGKQVAGVNTQLGNVATASAANGDRLAVNCNGSAFSAYLNDALMFTATSTDLATATKIGVQINGATFRGVDLFARSL